MECNVRDIMEDLGIYERVTLKQILNIQDMTVWTEYVYALGIFLNFHAILRTVASF
jgi:hypothetical protein